LGDPGQKKFPPSGLLERMSGALRERKVLIIKEPSKGKDSGVPIFLSKVYSRKYKTEGLKGEVT